MKHYIPKTLLLFSSIVMLLTSCNNLSNEPEEPICEHKDVSTRIIDEGDCKHKKEAEKFCLDCGEVLDTYFTNEYGDHDFKETVIKEDGYSLLSSTCTICGHTANEVIDAVNSVGLLSIPFTYVFLNDYEISLTYYTGLGGEVVIPSVVSYNNKNYLVKELGSDVFSTPDSNSITKIAFPSTLENLPNRFAHSLSNVKSIDLSNTKITFLDEAFWDLPSLEEVLFPSTLKYCYESFKNCKSLKELNFYDTSLLYFYLRDDVASFNNGYFPASTTLINSYSTNLAKYLFKNVYIDAPYNYGSTYSIYGEAINYNTYLPYNLVVRKIESKNTNVTIIYPDGESKVVTLPYGEFMYDIYKDEKYSKYGLYYDEKCLDCFSGMIPKNDLTLYIMPLDEKESVYFNKNTLTYKPVYDENSYIHISRVEELFPLIWYMLANEIYEVKIENELPYNLLNHYYFMLLSDPFRSEFSFDGMNGWFALNKFEEYYLFSRPTYEENVEDYMLDSVVYGGYNYKDTYKEFVSGNDRDESFSDFVYKDYPVILHDVVNPSLTLLALTHGIGVEVVPGSDADKCLKMYEDILKHIIDKDMTDYEKIVSIANFVKLFDLIGEGKGSYSTSGLAYFSNVVDLVPVYNGLNCASSSMTRMLYSMEGITCLIQNRYNHVYNIVKMGDLYYVCDDMRSIRTPKNENPLCGVYESEHDPAGASFENCLESISNMYPYVTLSNRSYRP